MIDSKDHYIHFEKVEIREFAKILLRNAVFVQDFDSCLILLKIYEKSM